jgi:hypothetical protein
MTPTGYGSLFAGGLFLGMVVLVEAGRRIGTRRLSSDPEGAQKGLGIVEGAVFSLLGLLIAFTFAGAATRFDGRRQLIVEEANTIGTAYQRIDLLPEHAQPALRELFRRYVDSRLETYRKLPDIDAAKAELARSRSLQGEIWSTAIASCRDSGSQPAHMLLLPALNPMFDIATTRMEAMNIHPPAIIFVMIGVLTLIAALLAGHGMAGSSAPSWVHTVAFAAVMALTVYVIIDIEYPRFGLISVQGSDRVLVELRESLK